MTGSLRNSLQTHLAQHGPIFKDEHDEYHGIRLVRAAGPQPATDNYIRRLCKENPEYGLNVAPEFLGFMNDYYHIAQYLEGHARPQTVIVDVGCAGAFQQVFFRRFPGYIGIDYRTEFLEALCPNVSFFSGSFDELIESGRFVTTEDMVGIANMSLLYGGGEKSVEAFNRVFKRKIIV
jgi:hypothetical protein